MKGGEESSEFSTHPVPSGCRTLREDRVMTDLRTLMYGTRTKVSKILYDQ